MRHHHHMRRFAETERQGDGEMPHGCGQQPRRQEPRQQEPRRHGPGAAFGRHDDALRGGRPGFGRDGEGFGRHGGHGEAGAGGPDRGRHGRRRMFESGELRLVMLLLIESEPRHGYDIIRELESRTGGAYAPSPGIVYPTLTLLEEVGQIETQASEGAKKLFAITSAGKAHLDENRAAAEAALARLEALRQRGEAMDAGPILRAMTNLKTALQQRIGDKAEKELIFNIADIVDEAARKIERL